jgi:hypothetical protein
MNIEEAWVALGKMLRWGPRVAMSHEVDPADTDLVWFEEEQAAACAFALAVLEEAVASANFIAGEGAIMDGHTLRARIEALGRAP